MKIDQWQEALQTISNQAKSTKITLVSRRKKFSFTWIDPIAADITRNKLREITASFRGSKKRGTAVEEIQVILATEKIEKHLI